MSTRILGWILMLMWSASAAWGDADGRHLISQADIPLTITNAGSYLVTENLTCRNGVLIPAASVWKYLDNGSNQGTNWQTITFNDSAWATGRAELGYGDYGVEATTVAKHITTYFRHSFVLTNAPAYTDLELYVRRDDGVVVYLNGTEVARDNMPAGTITYTTLASAEIPDGNATIGDPEAEYYAFHVPHALVVTGTNVIAAEVHMASAGSADMSFDCAFFGSTTGVLGESANGITIAADNVTLDLNGHTLTGVELGSLDGVHVSWGANVTIRNGTVTEWGEDGIDFLNTTNSRAESIRAIGNFRDGIRGGYACIVRNCVAYGNGMTRTAFEQGDGIAVEDGSIVSGCISRRNYDHGFLSHSSCEILDNVASRNGHDGLHGGQGNVVSRLIVASSIRAADGKWGDGVEINIGSVVMDSTCFQMDDGMKTRDETDPILDGRALFMHCTAYANLKDGIASQNGAIITQCTTVDNGDDGISVQNQCAVIGNTSCGNGFIDTGTAGGGVTVEGNRNRVQDNHLMGNENGVRADPSSTAQYNLITGNSAAGNLEDYRILNANNITGPRTNVPSRASAWANFEF